MHGMEYTPAIVEDIIVNAKTYHEFRFGLEDGPHAWLHRGIGGEMELPWSTNGPYLSLTFMCSVTNVASFPRSDLLPTPCPDR